MRLEKGSTSRAILKRRSIMVGWIFNIKEARYLQSWDEKLLKKINIDGQIFDVVEVGMKKREWGFIGGELHFHSAGTGNLFFSSENLGDSHFYHFVAFFKNKTLTHLEPVELEFVFAGRFCAARTEKRGALLVVRPEETKSEASRKIMDTEASKKANWIDWILKERWNVAKKERKFGGNGQKRMNPVKVSETFFCRKICGRRDRHFAQAAHFGNW